MTTQLHINSVDRSCDTDAVLMVTGRRQVNEPGSPSYARTDVDTADNASIVTTFHTLTVTDDAATLRHAGKISDADLTHDDLGAAVQRLTTVGALASWGRAFIGDEPWPAETVAQRAQRIAALVGQPITVQGGSEQVVIGRDVDRRQAYELLQELADGTGGWLFDHAGVIYLQALDYRKVTVETVTWDEDDPGAPWSALDPALTWADDDAPAAGAPIVLDCSEVQAGPEWQQTAEVSTVVEIGYGEPINEAGEQASVTRTDNAAVALYGQRLYKLATPLQLAADAAVLAALILERAARPQWRLSAVTLPWEWLREDTAARVRVMLPGTRVTVTGLPQPAPAASFPGVVEGWEERITGEQRTITLWLSHVSHSLAVPTWDAEPANALWNQLDPGLTWEEDL